MRKMIVLAAVLGLTTAAHAAQAPGQKCQSSKNQEAGKYASCLSKEEAKLLKTEGACSLTTATGCYDDGDCPMGETCTKDLTKYENAVSKCEDKFESTWGTLTQNAADDLDPCPDGLLVEELKEAVDEHVANVAAGLAGEGLSIGGGGPAECGDGGIDAGEDCDQGDLNGGTCAGEGFADGVLRCGAGCVYDTSGCYVARFEDNGDGTITDNDTGLMWEKKVKRNSLEDFANPHDADNFYRLSGTCSIGGQWCQPNAAAEAACLAGFEGVPDGCAVCVSGVCENLSLPGKTAWQWLVELNTANYAGHSDWRLATRGELMSIIDYADTTPPLVDVAFNGASCGVACTDVNDPQCSCTRSGPYWTASSHAPNPSNVFYITFNDGFSSTFTKASGLSVRAVRGGL